MAQVVQLDNVLLEAVYVPAEHALHTPLVPTVVAFPAAYAVLMYCPAGHDVTAVASPVLAVTLHALVTYCVLLGALHAVHDPAVFVADVYVLPAVHAEHTPSTPPPALALPATYAVLMYCPAGHDATAAAKPVLAVSVHALVTNCVLFGAAQLATGQVALVPALAPEAV